MRVCGHLQRPPTAASGRLRRPRPPAAACGGRRRPPPPPPAQLHMDFGKLPKTFVFPWFPSKGGLYHFWSETQDGGSPTGSPLGSRRRRPFGRVPPLTPIIGVRGAAPVPERPSAAALGGDLSRDSQTCGPSDVVRSTSNKTQRFWRFLDPENLQKPCVFIG